MGAGPDVAIAPARDLSLLLPVVGEAPLSAEMTYLSPVIAPVAAGDTMGEMIVRLGEGDATIEHRIPLLATADVPEGGLVVRLTTAMRAVLEQVFGQIPPPVGG
jgi:D-alanyl-D-alanine carboxypeptidase (penicillin-binding protein 5/6)